MSDRGRTLAAGAIVAALAALVYANALGNPFVFDDRLSVVENPSLGDPGNWRYLLLHDRFRPIVNLSYALDYARGGLDPRPYHVTSIALHALNAILVFAVAGCVLPAWRDRFAAGLLFAVHPVLSEAVGYTSGRSELLVTNFVLAGFLALRRAALAERRGERWAWASAALACLLLGLASKETAAMLPLVFLAYDRLFLPSDPAGRRRRWLVLHLPALAIVAALGAARVAVFLTIEAELAPRSLLAHGLVELQVFWRYVGLLVIPVRQSIVHAVTLVSRPTDWRALLAGAALIALVWVAVRLGRRAPALSFGIAWLILFLIPSSAIPLLELMAEHRLYLASAGFFLAAAWGLDRIEPRSLRTGILAATTLTLAVLTVRRNAVWADPLTLWLEAQARAPAAWVTNYALADVYRERGDCARAMPLYESAIALLPGEPRAYVNLGDCLVRAGRLDAARRVLIVARERCPDAAIVRDNLANLERQLGRR